MQINLIEHWKEISLLTIDMPVFSIEISVFWIHISVLNNVDFRIKKKKKKSYIKIHTLYV